jgi:hypothetical protein
MLLDSELFNRWAKYWPKLEGPAGQILERKGTENMKELVG